MKPGDLVAWTAYASDSSGWAEKSNGIVGQFAGTVVRVIPSRRPRLKVLAHYGSRPKVEILDHTGTFIVTTEMVNIISSANTNT
jgi:hypothetical protein